MSVLHVDTATEFRGGQRQLAYLLESSADHAWAGVPGSPLAAEVGPPAIALHPGNDPRNVLLLRNVPHDVVAAHTPHAHSAALLCGRPLVVHRRVDFPPRHPWKYRPVAATIAVSHAVATILRSAGIERVHVVHDGVRPPPDGEVATCPRPHYAAIGALVPHKGHAVLIEAMRRIPGTLVIAGEGPLRPKLEAMIRAFRLGYRVRLIGQGPVGGLLREIDALVHPSLEEGLGQVVIEALMLGTRVVATRAGGIPEAVEGYGRLVAPGDPEALADAMIAVLRDPHPVFDRDFSVERMCAATEAIYRAVATAGS